MYVSANVVFGSNLVDKEIKIVVSYWDEYSKLQEDHIFITKEMLKEVLESGE